MKILFIGDIVGKPGRRAVKELLPSLVSGHDVDMVIANCENAASGFGITREVVEELYDSHIDVLTSGNHVWDKKEVMEFIDDYESLIRPANYPAGVPGAGSVLMPTVSGQYVGVLNLAGRILMHPVDCPFTVAKKEIERLKSRTSVIIVDIHAGDIGKAGTRWYLDGEVSAVLGTHTHVQTADNEVLPNGTAYISDAGMTGPFDSVIGIKKDTIIERFLTQIPNRFDVAKNDVRLQGVVIDIDTQSGRANAIERISVKLNQ